MKKGFLLIFLLLSFLYSQSGWGPEIVAVYRDSLGYPNGSLYNSEVAVSGNTLHITWYWEIEDTITNYFHREVFYTRSVDGGLTWEKPRILSNLDSLDSRMPSICVNENSVHVAWEEGGPNSFQYRRSFNAGETWGSIQTLIPEGRSRGGWINNKNDTLVIAVAGLGVDSFKTWFRKSLNNGLSWSAPILVNFITVGYVKVGVFPPYIHIVGQMQIAPGAEHEIFYTGSSDLGQTWDRDTIISEIGYDSGQRPALYVSGSNIYVTWYDYKYSPYSWTGDIFLRVSYDNGFTWEPIRETVSTSHLATQSDVCAFNDEIHIVWVEELTPQNWELYYRFFDGNNWSQIERLTYADGWSLYPSLAYSNGKLHLVWVDRRPGSSGIYYRQKVLLNIEEKIGINYRDLKFHSNFLKDNLIIFELYKNEIPDIKVFDITGKKLDAILQKQGNSKYILNFKDYPSGIYFIYLNKTTKIKVIKRR